MFFQFENTVFVNLRIAVNQLVSIMLSDNAFEVVIINTPDKVTHITCISLDGPNSEVVKLPLLDVRPLNNLNCDCFHFGLILLLEKS